MRLACRPLVSSGNAKREVTVKSMSMPRHTIPGLNLEPFGFAACRT